MLALARGRLAHVALAHPLTQPFDLPVSPLATAEAAAFLVLLVAYAWPERRDGVPEGALCYASWEGPLSRSRALTRLGGAAFLALAILSGRLGVNDELENLAPALVIGAAWPLIVAASVTLGPIWRWVDPWDACARALSPGHVDEAPDHVWPATLVALPLVWYVSVYPDPLRPRSVGGMLALYTLATLAGCLYAGRVRWLATSEPVGILLSWLPLLPRRRLADWIPPRGAEALLGVLGGGVLFGAARRSELWGDLNTASGATFFATLGLTLSCAGVAGLLLGLARLAKRSGAGPGVARAVLPAVAGIIVAVAMDRNRLFTSVQLLPGLLGDPFGWGWDLLGRSGAGLDPAPLGVTGLSVAQIAVLLTGHLAGAASLRRLVRTARGPAAGALAVLAAASVISLATH